MANIVELKIVRSVSNNTSVRLRELVRQVRAAKTKSEEKAIVERELACIRVSFFNEYSKYKCRNMVKLVYLRMLGYSAEFGKIECIKLIGTKDKKFSDIRTGYLGASLLLDERSDVHLLLTNCFRNHLSDSDMFIVGNALCVLGNICSVDMCRDLASEVIKLLNRTTCNFVKKKAALCAYRFIRKVPDLVEIFVSSARSLLTERYNGVLTAGLVLVCEMCDLKPGLRTYFDAMIAGVARSLKNLQVTDFSLRHTDHGICDPYLQIKILKLLAVLGRDDSSASERMSDVLSHMTISSGVSNASSAILFETALTIMKTKSSAHLKALAVNIVDRFFMDPDRNIRYSSLSLLVKLAGNVDCSVIRRHRRVVLESLKDEDPSVRRLASRICRLPCYREELTESEADFKQLFDTTPLIESARRMSDLLYQPEKDDKSDTGCLLLFDDVKVASTSSPDQPTASSAPFSTTQNMDVLELLGFSGESPNRNNNRMDSACGAAGDCAPKSSLAVGAREKVDLANLFDLNNLNDLVLM